MLSILLALTSAVAYGASDFVGGLASRYSRAMAVVLIAYPVSFIIFAVAAPLVGQSIELTSLLWGAASGVVMALATVWFYSAMAHGPMNVVSPLTAVIVTVLPVLVGLFLGEQLSTGSFIGVGLAIIAVLLVSREPQLPYPATRPFTARIAWLTVGTGVGVALSFIFTDQIPEGTGLWPLVAARGAASMAIVLAAVGSRQLALPPRKALLLALMVGAFDVIANGAMLFAFQAGLLSIGSALISLYPAITIAMAMLFLREKTSFPQVVGLVLSAGAILTISLTQ
ncbi:DMT family transporter [Kocuria atrinae]|uniref:DMT family transporter n=1 Tax=Kocuria atrinae TaxID=592377 RepID=UPI00030C78C4|nr:DMT family transporter [Kocuria atrinae]